MARHTLQSFALVALSLVTAQHAAGQVCLGKPGFQSSAANVGISASFTDGARGVSSNVGFGNDKAFGGVGISYFSASDQDAGTTSFSGVGGLSVPASTGSKARLCPFVQGTYGYGPNQVTTSGTLKFTSLGLLGGLAIGGAVEVSPGFAVIPHASGGVLHQRVTASLDSESQGFSQKFNDTGGLIAGGVSLLFGTNFTIEPSVSVPVGFATTDPVFSIGFTIGFRRRM